MAENVRKHVSKHFAGEGNIFIALKDLQFYGSKDKDRTCVGIYVGKNLNPKQNIV